MPVRRTYSDAEKARALECYVEHGPAHASRETGIPAATIRTWAHRSGETVSRSEAADAAVTQARRTWAQRKAAVALAAGEVATESAEATLREIEAGRSRQARELMGAFAIAVDKAQLLDGGATGRLELSEPERVERVKQLRDELAERRRAKGEAVSDDDAETG